MDLGVFLPIANNGWIISRNAPQYLPTFELNQAVTLEAERLGFDFVLSMVKFRGFGGETRHWDYALESFTLMAGLAAVTRRIQLYASVQPLTLNPAMAARMGMTIDNISGGRFGLNIVAGWNKYEYEQMGLWPGDEFYGYRYNYAAEWLDIVNRLWESGRATYRGQYLTLDDCVVEPHLGRRPPIVCAGMSDEGIRFTARHGDINFVSGPLAAIQALVQKGRAVGEEFGKTIKTYAVFTVISGESDQEAEATMAAYVEGGDVEALANRRAAAGNDRFGATSNRLLPHQVFIMPPMAGGAESLADQIEALVREAGADGLLVTFPDFVSGMAFFGQEVLPRLEARGLRPRGA